MTKRATLIALAVLFFGPMLIAWIWFFYFQDIRPGTVNKGDLIEPPVAIGDLTLHERGNVDAVKPFVEDWSVVLLAPRECDQACERALHVTRQVWIRLNRDADRVQRMLIAGRDVDYPADEHLDLRVFDADENILRYFEAEDRTALAGADRVYLVDPYGNLMMSYALDFSPDMLNSDLKRVLKISEADRND